MTIELKVTWNNATSNLIANQLETDPKKSLVVVAQGGAAAPEVPSKRTKDSRVFVLQDDGDAKVTFNAMFDMPIGGHTGLQTMLKVIQRFTCTGGAIAPSTYDIQDPSDPNGVVAGIPGINPLVSLPGAAQAQGAGLMFVRTDFVDVTDAWLDRARIEQTPLEEPKSPPKGPRPKGLTPEQKAARKADLLGDFDQWARSPHFGKLRVLACLNGFPTLWFASIPNACANADAASALVFFRPAGYGYHHRGDDFSSVFSANHDFYKIWRFLLAPVCNHPAVDPLPPKGTAAATRGATIRILDDGDDEGFVAAAIERSLDEAGRPLVVLFPVPEEATYSAGPRGATTEALADLARLAVTCLHTRGVVMSGPKKSAFRHLKRFGLAGFSFGGAAMWAALKSAVSAAKKGRTTNTIREIYVFDANQWTKQQQDPTLVLTSAAQTKELRLRVSAGTKQGATLDSFPASATLQRSAHPDASAFPQVYDLTRMPATRPTNRWYFHYVNIAFRKAGHHGWFEKKFEGVPDEANADRGARHQFSVFGGEDAATGKTFLRRFLDDSDF